MWTLITHVDLAGVVTGVVPFVGEKKTLVKAAEEGKKK